MQVNVHAVTKSFKKKSDDKIYALEDINLIVHDGEFLCLLGPSGCGKSTLLNIVAGLDKPDSGKVTIDNKLIKDAGPDLGVVFQDGGLFPWLTVRGNVEFSLKMLGFSRERRREIALQNLQMVHLTHFTEAYPHELSGGMRQRAAIARTLAMDPKILLMDEPFSALDSQTRSMLHGELTEIWLKTKKAVIFITHNVEEALTLSDRIILFTARPGRIKKEFIIPYKRPRNLTSVKMIALQNEIKFYLQEEIEKVVKEQVDYGFAHPKVSVLSTVNNNMGSGL